METDTFQFARILIVDDEPDIIRILQQLLMQWGYTNVESTTDSREAVQRYTQTRPDLIILDLMMPHLDGFGVMEQLKTLIPEDAYLPIMVMTAHTTPQVRRRALAAGAKDFLTKPFDPVELLLRIRNLFDMRFMHLQLQNQNKLLEERVLERTQKLQDAQDEISQRARELEDSQIEILERLGRAGEFRDDDTGQHTRRVGELSSLLAREVGLEPDHVELIRRTAPLHDAGKIGIPDSILLKPDKLTPQEFDIMKTHTVLGAALLSGGRSVPMQMAERIALNHHERWDGSGYPNNLSGEQTPIEGRLVALADVFDGLTHRRPYKPAWPVEAAAQEIQAQSGRQFDAKIVAAFGHLLRSGQVPL